MLSLEYLSISANGPLFSLYSFVQFPNSLKYLDLYNVSNAGQILNWVAKECCNLKGLCLSVTENVIQVIPQLKGLTYLALIEPDGTKWISLDIGYVLESLTELRALLIQTLDEKVISAIARYCKKLEHLTIRKGFGRSCDVSAEKHMIILRLATLPSLRSLTMSNFKYSKGQTEELVSRLIANGNLEVKF
ncbi:hypothetical protein Ddc_13641 [Ditylenchus destructor]|nr:hypothetical protein Ddc_13641 [Ditylenchus destructor]